MLLLAQLLLAEFEEQHDTLRERVCLDEALGLQFDLRDVGPVGGDHREPSKELL